MENAEFARGESRSKESTDTKVEFILGTPAQSLKYESPIGRGSNLIAQALITG